MPQKGKYHVKMTFTLDEEGCLKPGVWTGETARRIIKRELDVEPCVENSGLDLDLRYETDDPVKALELLKIAFAHSDGGWWAFDPMPKGRSVFHIPPK